MGEIPEGWRPFYWQHGPIWAVGVGLPVPPGQPKPADHPSSLQVYCLLDCGSSHSFADPSVFRRLGAKPTGEHFTVIGAEEERQQPNYKVDLKLPFTSDDSVLSLRNYSVSAGVLSWGGEAPRYSVVIGGDVLRFTRFIMDGKNGLFRLETP